MKTLSILAVLWICLCIISSLSGEEVIKKVKKNGRHRRRKHKLLRTKSGSGPLMIFMLDGFRWDYVNRFRDQMPGFRKFLRDGVQAEWVDPIFPVVSYPAWTTLSTGVYPETHGIIGNYFFKKTGSKRDVFSLGNMTSTKQLGWWQNSEPIWITASRHRKKTFLRYWSRCDVPFKGLLPDECIGYKSAPGVAVINNTLTLGLQRLLSGVDLVMVYGEHIDNVGHGFGPNSFEMRHALRQVDKVFAHFLENLSRYPQLKEKLNIIVVSDHGMTGAGPETNVRYLWLDDYINKNLVFRAVDSGSVIFISPAKGQLNPLYEQLKRIPGVDVYKKSELPDSLHYKNNRLVLDLILIARPGYAIHGLKSTKHIPFESSRDFYWGGIHGYTPDMQDQKAIFFAAGPAFKKNRIHPPIQMVDIYQIYTHLLGIPAQPHNGTWTNVAGMFV